MIIDSLENKQKILGKFLDICSFDGWNQKTLEKAVIESGIEPKYTALLFENGALGIADFFISQNNQELSKIVESQAFVNKLKEMKIRDKIKLLVQTKLEINSNYKAAIKSLISFYSNPKYSLFAIRNSYKNADLIWHLIGDKSTDFNFYTKRIILSKIYIRTLIFFVKDNSTDNQKTWDFLDAQIEKTMRFGAFKAKMSHYVSKTKDLGEKLIDKKHHLEIKSPKDLLKKLPFFRLFN